METMELLKGLYSRFKVNIRWMKGHSEVTGNELADGKKRGKGGSETK